MADGARPDPAMSRERAPVCRPAAVDRATIYEKSRPGRSSYSLPELGLHCARKAAYLRERLLALPGVTAFTEGPVFREFAVRLPRPAAEVVEALAPEGFLAGVAVSRFAGRFDGSPAGGGDAATAALDDVLLLAVTEKRTRAELDGFADALGALLATGEVDRG